MISPILGANLAYEKWLRRRLTLVPGDLKIKYKKMRASPFAFLRASFFRWVELWPQVCSDLASAPAVLGVGDIHIENFGIWRDAEGRLVWGVNDFDEAESVPYTSDLVRLCTSAILALETSPTNLSARRASEAVLSGYRNCLTKGGTPIVLSDAYPWLVSLAEKHVTDAARFWRRLESLESVTPSREVRALLEAALPTPRGKVRFVHRVAGLGSLGRQRFAALMTWRGGPVAREAKALTVSAVHWRNKRLVRDVRYREILRRAGRAPDPSTRIHKGWVIRRLAPDAWKIGLDEVPRRTDLKGLLEAMGWELGNIHLGSPRQLQKILRDLDGRKERRLQQAAENMAEITERDWRAWKKGT